MDRSLYLNRREEIDVNLSGKLPHWSQDGTLQFVTMRLCDSLPAEVLADLKARRESFLIRNPKPWTPETAMDYHRVIGSHYMGFLDTGYGECILRHPSARTVVEESISFHEGLSFDVLSYVIMPNHMHLLARFYPTVEISRVIASIKRFTTNEINRQFGRSGKLWQDEYHDRIIRNSAHLDNCLGYIHLNPVNLAKGTYSLYRNEILIRNLT